jgi:hypothetical protein
VPIGCRSWRLWAHASSQRAMLPQIGTTQNCWVARPTPNCRLGQLYNLKGPWTSIR